MAKLSEKYLQYNEDELTGAVEAVLFAAGESVSKDRLSDIFEITPSEVDLVMKRLEERLDKTQSGIELVRTETSYQICTRTIHADFVTKYLEIKRMSPMSKPALEVLAVVAYRQPVTKGYVEQIRGVDCSGIMNTLVEKGLVEEKGRLDAPGRPILYGTTLEFLKRFGLNSISDLPEIDDGQMKMPVEV
ncbi:MAG: SMC-Scp complex subunit ScpB [Ruminococcaceae bacterium]|nr:SMC-Scp complex subunit ScpB [Oscillospiraceae bacterium]